LYGPDTFLNFSFYFDMEIKKCNTCKLEKNLDEFHKDKKGSGGVGGKCKVCKKIHGEKYYYDNIEYHTFSNKIWNENNVEKISKYNKLYNELNKDKIRIYDNYRYNNIPECKIRKLIKSYLVYGFKNILEGKEIKSKRTLEIIGCTFEEFKLYIESKFESWMTWENHGLYNGELNYGWDFDHIIPISSSTCGDDVYKLNHFSNFQPLCSKINRDIKRNLLDYSK